MAFRLASGVLTQKLGAETVLMHLDRGEYFELNQSGSDILEALLGGDEQAAVRALTQRYATNAATAQRDVSALVQALRASTLLCSD
jgi:hypothetical protein